MDTNDVDFEQVVETLDQVRAAIQFHQQHAKYHANRVRQLGEEMAILEELVPGLVQAEAVADHFWQKREQESRY